MFRSADNRRHPARTAWVLLFAVILTVTATIASARTNDRKQPMDIEAGRQVGTFSGDSVNTLSGGVHITQGSLDIQSSTARITLAAGDPVRAVFNGGPVKLKQQMDDGSPMNASAKGVDYNLKSEIVVFTGDVHLQQPSGSLSGERVVYNLKTGSLEGGGEGNGRVKMRILPSGSKAPAAQANKAATPDQGQPSTTLQPPDPPATVEGNPK